MKPYRIQYSHDKEKWFDFGPSIDEGCIPILFPSVERCREIIRTILLSTYAGHPWYQRILTEGGEVVENWFWEEDLD